MRFCTASAIPLIFLSCLATRDGRAEPPSPHPATDSRDTRRALAIDVTLQVSAISGPGQRRALPPGAPLRSGDRFVLTLSAARAAHVYVAQVSATGETTLLSSADGKSAVLLAPGQEVVLPGGGRSFRLDDQVGTENLLVLAAERALTAAEQAQSLQRAQKQPPPPPPPPPPGPTPPLDRPAALPDQSHALVVRATAAHGQVALLRFPLQHRSP